MTQGGEYFTIAEPIVKSLDLVSVTPSRHSDISRFHTPAALLEPICRLHLTAVPVTAPTRRRFNPKN